MNDEHERAATREAIGAQVRALLERWHGPALGTITTGTDPRPHPVDGRVVFTGGRLDAVVGPPTSRVVVVGEDAAPVDPVPWGGATRFGRWSADGTLLAFTADHALRGVHQPAWLTADLAGEPATVAVPGTVESLSWSPSGHRLLAVVAGLGAEQAGAMASGRVPTPPVEHAPGEAQVRSFGGVPPANEWRRAWVIDTDAGTAACVTPDGPNVWEASWLGDDALVAIVSDRPEEDAWYGARCSAIDLATGAERVLATSDRQLGVPVGWADGARAACIEAPCSDRTLVAGRVLLLDPATADVRRLEVGVDATHLLPLTDGSLLASGLVGMDTHVVSVDPATGTAISRWATTDAVGPRQPEAWATPAGGIVVALDSWDRPPAVVEIDRDGDEHVRWSGAHAGTEAVRAEVGPMRRVTWTAPDGWPMDGLLVAPDGAGPHPLVMYPHGGPVASWRRRFLGGYALVPTLLARGWAVFLPNPRGSAGYGWAFADAVHGDMGGLDTHDLLSGIDQLVDTGVVDGARLAVTGGSYAGYLTCWLVTQTDRFGAAAASAPVTNWISQHYQSNIPEWGLRFLPDTDRFPRGGHVDRSPVFLAGRVSTPTWLSAGAHDRCCPPTQCLEFHEALRAVGVPTELVIYPDDAHNVPTGDRQVDFVARVVEWIERWCRP